MPFNNWMKTRSFKKHIDILNSSKFKNRGYLNHDYIEHIISDFYNKKDTFINSNANKVWMLVNLEKFTQQFFENRKNLI